MIITRNDLGINTNRFLFKLNETDTLTQTEETETTENLRNPDGTTNMKTLLKKVQETKYGIERNIT